MRKFSRRVALALLLMALLLLMSGCGMAVQVENQAYALVIGLDREADGQLRMSALIPKISGNATEQESASSGGAGNYARLEVVGENYDAALEKLRWAAPRTLNLSHLELIVMSSEIAQEVETRQLISIIAQTEHLFTSACIAVCEGSACEFVAALKPSIGIRLSADINASLKYYTSLGLIPDGCLSDLHYRTESVYSDPLAIYAVLGKAPEEEGSSESGEDVSAFAFNESTSAASDDNESEILTRYLGAAVFSAKGRMCGVFSPHQTAMANLIRNTLENLHYELSGENLVLLPVRAPFISVDLKEDPIRIHVSLRIGIQSQDRTPDEDALRRSLESDIQDVFHAAQQMGAEPFGFAERAAVQFATMDDWVDYHWIDRFRDAKLELEILFTRVNA